MFELVSFLLSVESFHVAKMATNPGIFFNSEHVIEHLAKVLGQVVIVGGDLPLIRDAVEYAVCL